MELIFLFVILIVIFCVFKGLLNGNNIEGFLPEYEYYNTNIIGYDKYGFPPYKKLNLLYPRGVTRKDQMCANKWETRLPSLVDERYSYNDMMLNKDSLQVLTDVARLGELPLDLQNRYSAIVDNKFAQLSLAYYPDVQKPVNKDTITSVNMDYLKNYPYYFVGNYRYGNTINGHNPNDSLPAQYADRSKTSLEANLAPPIGPSRIGPMHGWLPNET
jgi:hypothetical protein